MKIVDHPGIRYPRGEEFGRFRTPTGSDVDGDEQRRYEKESVSRQRRTSRRVGRNMACVCLVGEVGAEEPETPGKYEPSMEVFATWGDRRGEKDGRNGAIGIARWTVTAQRQSSSPLRD